jgi:ribonuclease VapC
MFVDASAIFAIIAQESDWRELSKRLARADQIFVSPLSIWEAAVGLARESRYPFEKSEHLVNRFIQEIQATTIGIDDEIGREALRASRLYGKGRHRAALNFGDCFSYACAKILNVPLLCKGNDFPQTDIELA